MAGEHPTWKEGVVYSTGPHPQQEVTHQCGLCQTQGKFTVHLFRYSQESRFFFIVMIFPRENSEPILTAVDTNIKSLYASCSIIVILITGVWS